jgi:mRNA-degrading endonuclease RelE of RelBE toxin-antitoxin system
MTEFIWTEKFEREVKKIKNPVIKERIKKVIKKILERPGAGKPLRYALKGERTLYIKPFRFIYAVQGNTIYFLRFEHRKHVYG